MTTKQTLTNRADNEDRLSQRLLYHPKQHYTDYLRQFNQLGAPKLRTEEGALQWLAMRHAYLPLQQGDILSLAIDRNLLGQHLASYNQSVYVNQSLIDQNHGCVAYSLLPNTKEMHEQVAIIVFRGTTRPQKYKEQRSIGYPTGFKADLDPNGIGYRAFAHNAPTLLQWCHYALDRGCQLVITGHSLGGVFAKRLAAALDKETQAKTKIITFNSPGIDSQTAQRISENTMITAVRNPLDLVIRFGDTLPKGTHLVNPQEIWDYQYWLAHGIPHLAISELDDRPLRFVVSEHNTNIPHQWAILEQGRRHLGYLIHDHLLP